MTLLDMVNRLSRDADDMAARIRNVAASEEGESTSLWAAWLSAVKTVQLLQGVAGELGKVGA